VVPASENIALGLLRARTAGDRILFDSYHCNRVNTKTRRLTRDQFRDVFRRIRRELEGA
jgi:uracil-DNA glycosylase